MFFGELLLEARRNEEALAQFERAFTAAGATRPDQTMLAAHALVDLARVNLALGDRGASRRLQRRAQQTFDRAPAEPCVERAVVAALLTQRPSVAKS